MIASQRTLSRFVSASLCLFLLAAAFSLEAAPRVPQVRFEAGETIIETSTARFVIDPGLRMNATRITNSGPESLCLQGSPLVGLEISGTPVSGLVVDPSRSVLHPFESEFGHSYRIQLVATGGKASAASVEVHLQLAAFDEFPDSLRGEAQFKISGASQNAQITSMTGGRLTLGRRGSDGASNVSDLWILQGGSYWSRPDWILPLESGFAAENNMKQRIDERQVGGGLPALDVWGPTGGVLVGSLSKVALPISLPARVAEDRRAEIGIEWISTPVAANAGCSTGPFVIAVHGGDFFDGLQTYAALMAKQGLEMLKPPDAAYEPIWCSWGFGPDFTVAQFREMLPVAQRIGFGVATVDAGWFAFNGDYAPRSDTFPAGEKDLRRLVDDIHARGLKAKLWLTTAVAGEKLAAQHPDWLVRNASQEPVGFTFGEGLSPGHGQFQPYLCPALPEVLDYYRSLARRIVRDWDFDGFKTDQNFINGIPECYAANHHHASPAASIAALADIDRVIQEEATSIKPDAIFEVCPCGAFPDFYKLPHYNQPVSSDFNSAWQIRHRGKVIKALMGANAAYYGDHFERRYSPENLPSMIGVGGIPGSMAVLRERDNAEFLRIKYPSALTPDHKRELAKWLGIYRQTWLSKGEYLNLYDIAHDRPEAHVISKDGTLYFAFFANQWSGPLELRGLDPSSRYSIVDYENHRTFGAISGGDRIEIPFTGHLLLSATPIDAPSESR